MDKKNNKPKRSFIPQSIGDTVKKINKNFSSKFGKIEFVIHSNWHNIVGSYFTDFSQPNQVTRIPDIENDYGEKTYKNYLNVSVAPAAAIEFQHFKDTIIEKINSYFGYKAIIDLRIHQNYITKGSYKNIKMSSKVLNHNDKENINRNVDKLQNQDLKKSLISLGTNMKGSENE